MEDKHGLNEQAEDEIGEGLVKICKFCNVHDGVWRCDNSDEMMCDGCYTWHVKSNSGIIKEFDFTKWKKIKNDEEHKADSNVIVKSREILKKICKICNVHNGVWRYKLNDEMMCDGCYTWHVKSNAGIVDFDINDWTQIKAESLDDLDNEKKKASSRENFHKICKICNVHNGVWRFKLSDVMMCDGCYTWHVKSNAGIIDFDINDWTKIKAERLDVLDIETKKAPSRSIPDFDSKYRTSENPERKCKFCCIQNGVWSCIQNDEIMCDGCYTWHVKSNEGQVKGLLKSDWINLKNENVENLKKEQLCSYDCSNVKPKTFYDRKDKDTSNDNSKLKATLVKCMDSEKSVAESSNDLTQSVSVIVKEVCSWTADLKCKIDQTTNDLIIKLKRLNEQHLEKVAQLEHILREGISDMTTAIQEYEDEEKDTNKKIHRREEAKYVCKKCQSSNMGDQVDTVDNAANRSQLEEKVSCNNRIDTLYHTDSLPIKGVCKSDNKTTGDRRESSIQTNEQSYTNIDELETKKSSIGQHLKYTEKSKVEAINDTEALNITQELQPEKGSKTIMIHIKESSEALPSTEEKKVTSVDINDLSTSTSLLLPSDNTELYINENLQSLLVTEEPESNITSDIDQNNKDTFPEPSLSLNFDSNDLLPLKSESYKPCSLDSGVFKSLSQKNNTALDLNLSPDLERKGNSEIKSSVVQTNDLAAFLDQSIELSDADTTQKRDHTLLPEVIVNKSVVEINDPLPKIKSNQNPSSEYPVIKKSTEVRQPVPHPPASPPDLVKKSTAEGNNRQVRLIQFPHPPQNNKSSSIKHLASETKVIYSFSIQDNRSRVAAINRGQAWLWSCSKLVLTLVSSDGRILENITTDFPVYDVATTKSAELLVTQSDGRNVMRMTADRMFTSAYRAPIGYTTRGITVKSNGDFIVVLYKYRGSKLVEVKSNGQTIKSIESYNTKHSKKLFINPYIICTNVNGDVIISEEDRVVGVTGDGCWKFSYTLPAKSLKAAFNPVYTVTDKFGHVIISDYNNSVLHMLDQDGKFIQYVMTDTHGCNQPAGLSIDTSGKLWVCCAGENKLFIIKYLSS